MPASNGAPIDSVDSSFGLTTPRGYSGAKEVCHFRGINVILSVFARNPILTSSEIILRCHKVDVILMISVFIKVFNKQLGIYQRPMSAHGVSSLSFVWPCFSLNFSHHLHFSIVGEEPAGLNIFTDWERSTQVV